MTFGCYNHESTINNNSNNKLNNNNDSTMLMTIINYGGYQLVNHE